MASWKSEGRDGDRVNFFDGLLDEVEKGKTLTEEEMVSFYDQWAKDGSYDKLSSTYGYGALDVLEGAMEKLFPDNKDDVTILDVGACTGSSGERLYQMGFRAVDALDPSSESLRVAKHKGVYRNLYNVPMTDRPLDIPENSYDAMTVCGAMGPKHMPLNAFTEMIRLTKPGGYIVNLARRQFLERCDEYIDQWERTIEGHVTAGRWRLVEVEHYDCHYVTKDGYKHVFQIC